MNKILTFDTLKYANRLKEINVPPEQAELQAEVMKEVLESALQAAELATKSDIALVQKDIGALEQRVTANFDGLKKDMDALGNKLTIRITTIVIAVFGAIQVLAALLQR